MDFINPRKRRASKIRLRIGYVLMGVLILMTTTVLLYDAYGYGFGKNGQLIQNGLVFLSSNPASAQIRINGSLNSSQTNSRLQLPAGQYTVQLTRAGYRSWVRAVGVEGGSVEHFDYPFLFPQNLVTTDISSYRTKPGLILQSPDRRWLLVEQAADIGKFTEYDLSNQKQLANSAKTIALPGGLLTATASSQNLKLIDWADPNYVLLQHNFSGHSEYILFDRQTPSSSVNLTRQLNLSGLDQLSLYNGKHDQFYLFNPSSQTLATIAVADGVQTPLLSHVLAFKTYGNNVVLYATDQSVPKGKFNVDVWQNNQSYTIQQLNATGKYLLGITRFNGDWYVIDGVSSDTKVYVYKDPVSSIQNQSDSPLVPAYILKVANPNYVSFSTNNQFAMAQSGVSFAVFDAQNQKGYSYKLDSKFSPGQHANWMDGYHLDVSTGGTVQVWDYDGANQQILQPGLNASMTFFDQNYKWAYTLAPSTPVRPTAKYSLTSTALRIPADQ